MLVFVKGGKPENPEKNPQSKARTNNKLNPHNYGTGQASNPATLVIDDRCHHWAIPVLLRRYAIYAENSNSENILKTKLFENHYYNHVIFLTEFSSNTTPKWQVIDVFYNFLGVVWTKNNWCVFRAKTPVNEQILPSDWSRAFHVIFSWLLIGYTLRRSVDGKHLMRFQSENAISNFPAWTGR